MPQLHWSEPMRKSILSFIPELSSGLSPAPAADRDAITAVEEEEEEEGPIRLTVTAEDKKTDGAEKCSI
ncbi:hypothetical protein QQF64_028769 [Cirrhinus molitorella]|uniref:Uncharacterized protein n=2 Tax=Cirrhinus molitorella TaxID=172907 RepID=A0ABR3N810_9TELE|nr:hypothetical protein Q8A67_014520 [Cirrhinus molitorella]